MKVANLLPRRVVDQLVRRKAALHRTPLDRFRVTVARTLPEYEEAFALLHVAYAYLGVEGLRGTNMRITAQHVLPESTVFVAFEREAIVGTLTVTLDSPAGLPLHRDYPAELKSLTRAGAKLAEIGSLAVVRRCWSSGVATLLSVAGLLWVWRVLKATHALISINPKAEAWYRALYNFHPLGPARHHRELGAAMLGMVSDVTQLEAFIRRHHGHRLANGVSFSAAFCGVRFPGIDLPNEVLFGDDLTRWKMPREVFQDLFIRKSDMLDSLDPQARQHLEAWRSPLTLETRE